MRSAMSFAGSAIVAQHLAPSEYGALMTAVGVFYIAGICASLGLDQTVVKCLIENPDHIQTLRRLVRRARLGAAIFVFPIATLVCVPITEGGGIWIALVAAMQLLQLLNVFDLEFQSKLQARKIAVSQTLAMAASTCLRILAAKYNLPIEAFAAILFLESAITLALASLLADSYTSRNPTSPVDFPKLVSASRPMLASALAIAAYTRVDLILVAQYLSLTSAANYGIASRIFDALSIVPLAIASASFPGIVKEFTGENCGGRFTVRAIQTAFYSSCAVAIVIAICSSSLIHYTFGEKYEEAPTLLSILAFGLPFLALGSITTRILISQELTVVALRRSAIVASLSIAANLVLLNIHPSPYMVAAVFTVSQILSGFLLDLGNVNTRRILLLKCNAIFFRTPS